MGGRSSSAGAPGRSAGDAFRLVEPSAHATPLEHVVIDIADVSFQSGALVGVDPGQNGNLFASQPGAGHRGSSPGRPSRASLARRGPSTSGRVTAVGHQRNQREALQFGSVRIGSVGGIGAT